MSTDKEETQKFDAFLVAFMDLAVKFQFDNKDLKDFLCSACVGVMARDLPTEERIDAVLERMKKAIFRLQSHWEHG